MLKEYFTYIYNVYKVSQGAEMADTISKVRIEIDLTMVSVVREGFDIMGEPATTVWIGDIDYSLCVSYDVFKEHLQLASDHENRDQ